MKVMFISDIHGSYYYAKKAIEIFEEQQFDQLVILGDVLYHGPRNPLTKEYDCMKVAELLNQYASKIIAVRGNCDSEVDQMVLDFDVTKSYVEKTYNGIQFFFTHGHLYNEELLPDIEKGTVLMYGHFHVPLAKKENDIYICNPSSISLPKEGTNSYGVLEGTIFTIKTFESKTIKTLTLTNIDK